MLNGFAAPYTPSGGSSLLAAPPRHHAGQVLSLAFTIDRPIVQGLLPEGLGEATRNPAEPIGLLAAPTFGLLGSPTLIGSPDAGERRLVRASVETKLQGPAYAATGSLAFFNGPRDELDLLSPRAVTTASLCTFALTVTGAVEA